MKKTPSLGKIEASLPKLFVERLRYIIPASHYQEVLLSFSIKRPTTLRANTLKIKGYKLRKRLADQRILIHPVVGNKDAFTLSNISLRDLEKTEEYQEGLLYVQSLSSMIPVRILDPKPGEKILDIAAAPGSKTTQIGSLMENKGIVVANDTSLVRILKLKANLERQGVTNVTITQKAGQRIWMDYPEYFDRVLADVPCSMEGRFSIYDRDSFKRWSLRNIKKLSHEQKYILRSAVSSTKVGGTIVYSTCTLAPEENEEVIEWILEKEKGKVLKEKSQSILPNKQMEGFYIVKLRKIASTIPKSQ